MEVVDYPNYLIYPDGKVYNQKYKRYLKPSMNNSGYLYVNLWKNSKDKKFSIHRLIAIYYIPNPQNKPFINHIDGNKLNNNISNLEWCTPIENLNAYRSKQSNNTSGIVNIRYREDKKRWIYEKKHFGNRFRISNENKQIILWIKFYDYLILKCI